MNQQIRIPRVVAIALIFALAFFRSAAISTAAADDRITIGFILPLSGDWAYLGNGVRDAALLAEKDAATRKYPVRLIFEDNAGELKNSATAVSKLISVDHVDAIVSIVSGVGLLIAPVAEKAKVLNFGLCSNTSVANGSYSFTNYITTREGADAYLKELVQRYSRPVKLGIFSLNEAGFNQIVTQVKLQSAGKPVQIQFSEPFEPGTQDFRSQIARSLKVDTDALLLLGLSPEIETFSRQLRAMGKNLPLSSIEAFGLAEDKAEFKGTWFVDAAAPSVAFESRFRSTYGRDITAAAAHAYDTVQLIAEAFEKIGSGEQKPSTSDVARFLRTHKKFQGVVGELTVDADGIIHSVPSVKVVP